MTREEAIVVLKNEQPHCGEKALFSEEKKYEAFDLAIKALEHEPVLDKVKTEIDRQEKWLLQLHTGYTAYNVDIAFSAIKSVLKESEVEE